MSADHKRPLLAFALVARRVCPHRGRRPPGPGGGHDRPCAAGPGRSSRVPSSSRPRRPRAPGPAADGTAGAGRRGDGRSHDAPAPAAAQPATSVAAARPPAVAPAPAPAAPRPAADRTGTPGTPVPRRRSRGSPGHQGHAEQPQEHGDRRGTGGRARRAAPHPPPRAAAGPARRTSRRGRGRESRSDRGRGRHGQRGHERPRPWTREPRATGTRTAPRHGHGRGPPARVDAEPLSPDRAQRHGELSPAGPRPAARRRGSPRRSRRR